MKQYKGLVQKGNTELILPISDGQSFIFSFPASAYKKAKKIGISLYFDKKFVNTRCFDQSDGAGTIKPDDLMVVIRIDKSFAARFKAYVNDHYIDVQWANDSGIANQVDAAGVAIDSPDAVAITLTVFEYTEYGKVEAFVQTMRNLESSKLETEDEEWQALERREKELSADGADRVNSPSVSETVSADANWMRYSSTVAWPTAVELVASDSVMHAVKVAHDQLMCAWVVQRGGNTSLSTYDYFAHSHGAAWPAAVAGYKFDKILKKVQERHGRLMMLVPLARVEGSS